MDNWSTTIAIVWLYSSAILILIHMIYVVLLCSLTYSISRAPLGGSSTSLNYRCGKMDGNEINEPTISPFYTVVLYVYIYIIPAFMEQNPTTTRTFQVLLCMAILVTWSKHRKINLPISIAHFSFQTTVQMLCSSVFVFIHKCCKCMYWSKEMGIKLIQSSKYFCDNLNLGLVFIEIAKSSA